MTKSQEAEETRDLFTSESLAFHAEQNIGRPSLLRPVGFTYLTSLLCIIIVFGISYLASKSYTRKESVSGSLIKTVGSTRVFAEKTGIVSELKVEIGNTVTSGDVVAIVHSNLANQLAEGTTSKQEYDKQIQQQQETKRIRQKQHLNKLAHLAAQRQTLEQQLTHLENQLISQSLVVSRTKTLIAKSEKLFKTGHLSRLEWNRLEEQVNQALQQQEELKAKKQARIGQIELSRLEMNAAVSELSTQLLQLDIQISALTRNRNRLSRETKQVVLAPISGTIATIFRTEGAKVHTQRPILSIQPHNTDLEAELYLPGHTVGFIEPGQSVNLLYDAYPYQQFGSYPAVLRSISSHPVTANDTAAILPNQGAMYLARVVPRQSTVSAYGNVIELREGMSLKADVVLDKRSLLEWLFEPLLVHKGRTNSL